MLFWIIALLIVAGVVASLAAPLLRPADAATVSADMAVYRDQLAEVDRDLSRGLLDPTEAERTRVEVSRRMLAADRVGPPAVSGPPAGADRLVLALVALLLVAGSLALYARLGAPGYPDIAQAARIAAGDALRQNRVSQAEAVALVPVIPAADVPAADLDLIVRLREAVQDHPEAAQGWAYLADYEARLGNYPAAAQAQDRFVTLRGVDSSVADHVLLVDLQVAAAAGFVSPEVELTLRRLLAADPLNVAARYYTGLLYAQTDRPDIAYRLWRAVAEEADQAGTSDDFHVQLARQQVEAAAFQAGVDYVLPPLAAGPVAADVAAAADLTPEQRQEMIAGMVAQLADRLATQGGPVGDWARLVTSLAVLGDLAQAEAILAEARDVFVADPAALAVLATAAAQAGLAP